VEISIFLLLEGGLIALQIRALVLQKKSKGFQFYGHDFSLRASRERYIRIFRYPRHDKIVQTMTFRRIILRIFLLHCRIQKRSCGFTKNASRTASLTPIAFKSFLDSRRFFLSFFFTGIRSIMVTPGVLIFGLHITRFGSDRRAVFTSFHPISGVFLHIIRYDHEHRHISALPPSLR
jgi:hypothetical protein